MKLWLRQGASEGHWLYIEHEGTLYLVYFKNIYGRAQIRIRKLESKGTDDGTLKPAALKRKDMAAIPLDSLLAKLQAEKDIWDDPFAFNIKKAGRHDEYKLGMADELKNYRPRAPKKTLKGRKAKQNRGSKP